LKRIEEPRRKSQEERAKKKEPRRKSQEERIKKKESRRKNQEERVKRIDLGKLNRKNPLVPNKYFCPEQEDFLFFF